MCWNVAKWLLSFGILSNLEAFAWIWKLFLWYFLEFESSFFCIFLTFASIARVFLSHCILYHFLSITAMLTKCARFPHILLSWFSIWCDEIDVERRIIHTHTYIKSLTRCPYLSWINILSLDPFKMKIVFHQQ